MSFFIWQKGRVTDITLCLALLLALLAYIQRRYYFLYFFAGLAALVKGPVGIISPVTIIFFYLLVTRQLAEIFEMKIIKGGIITLAVALPWYLLMYKLNGSIFVDTFIGFHNITSFTSPEHPECVLWYYFIPVLLAGFFPWIAILPEATWKALTESGKKYYVLLFLNIRAWFILGFFTISQTKLVFYILPCFRR